MSLKMYVFFAVIIIILVSGLCFFSSKLGDKLSRLQGEYETLKKVSEQDKQILDKEIQEREKAIVFLQNAIKAKDGEIAKKNGEIAKKNENINKKSKELSGLQKEREQLAFSGNDKDKIIQNLDEQVKTWSEKFSIAEGVIKDKDAQIDAKDAQIDALKLSFVNQVDITDAIKKQLDNEKNLRYVAEEALVVASFEIKKLKFTSSLKSMLVLAVSGYFVYDLVKK